MADPVIAAEGLDVFYGASQILFGVSLAVDRGQTVALLGRNGAGKTTTLKALAGLIPARAGRIRILGAEMQGQPAHALARAGVGWVPEDRRIFPMLSVEDNLLIGAKRGRGGEDHWNLERVYELFPLLASLRGRLGGLLSGGEQQMLTIARALMGNPSALLLDEPSQGLAPTMVRRIADLLRQLRDLGFTVLLAEQNMHFCLGIATRAVIIDKGQVVCDDTLARLEADAEVKQRYLAF